MEVQLYVYDLSKGLAKQLSLALLGTHIEAVYHTSLVFGGVEYLFGHGLQTCIPGSSHHGAPMEIIPLGTTLLPEDVIAEYLGSLKEIYTAESYDLFLHNCNNFSHDFATFLVGKGIPEHITSLPQTVLNTPFGQMLKPQLDQAMRSVTQAPLPASSAHPAQTTSSQLHNDFNANGGVAAHNPVKASSALGRVHNVLSLRELEPLLASATKSCAAIFFTSSTCPPCKLIYPAYDELAEEAGRHAVLIKVDIGHAYDVGAKYGVRATPTIMTFLKGRKDDEWSGADEAKLRGNIRLLVQMAQHPHHSLDLPLLANASLRPVTYAKVPPLDKLMAKMGSAANDTSVVSVKHFVAARSTEGPREATLPDMNAFSRYLRRSTGDLPQDVIFTVIDLFRSALIDARFSGYFAEETGHETVISILDHVNSRSIDQCPYSLRIVTLQAACNLFSSPLYPPQILSISPLTTPIIQLATTSLLDDKHANVRVAASSLVFNMAAYNYQQRVDRDCETLPESDQVELLASLLEAISVEEDSAEAMRGLLLAVGLLVRCAPENGEVWDMLKVMGARGTVTAKAEKFPKEGLVKEVGEELLGKGVK